MTVKAAIIENNNALGDQTMISPHQCHMNCMKKVWRICMRVPSLRCESALLAIYNVMMCAFTFTKDVTRKFALSSFSNMLATLKVIVKLYHVYGKWESRQIHIDNLVIRI